MRMPIMIQENEEIELCFSLMPNVGPVTYHALCKKFAGPRQLYGASRSELELHISPKRAADMHLWCARWDYHFELKKLAKLAITFIGYSSPLYPSQLRSLSDAPIGLFVRGNECVMEQLPHIRCMAIVGTRRATSYGRDVTQHLAATLSEAGWCIVSGLAAGIDAQAHSATLERGNPTIAFLGCGVDVIYPAANSGLYRAIEREGLVMSEFAPGLPPQPGLFVSRNRLVAGISEGVIVIEAGIDSGAMVTAQIAADQGKEVFAVPGHVTSAMSRGPNRLIRDGAHVVLEPADVLDYYGMRSGEIGQKIAITDQAIWQKLSTHEQKLVSQLMREPYSLDELVELLGFSTSELLGMLSLLELQNLVKKNEQSRYYLA